MDGDDPVRDLANVTREGAIISLRVRGTAIMVAEVTMQNLGPFIKACAPFLSAFDQLDEVKETAGELKAAGGNSRHLNDKFGFFRMIGESSGAFLDAAALVCEVDGHIGPVGARAFLARLRPDEFLHVALAMVEVNGDFFILRLMPALQRFLEGVGRIGLSPSSVSSALGTISASSFSTASPSSSATSEP